MLTRLFPRDPNDERVLEAAIHGRAPALITHNMRDFGDVESQFGVAVLPPADALRRFRT
jgi:predicted nucleic acid-binding protein